MYDGIKFSVLSSPNLKLLGNPLLHFEQRNIGRDGELLPVMDSDGTPKINGEGLKVFKTPYTTANYRSLIFKVFDNGYVEVTGSLHKYFNEGTHNYNDFHREDLKHVLKDLEEKFGIDGSATRVKNLEFGVNLNNLTYQTSEILDHSIAHSTKLFEEKYNSDKGKYIQAEHSQMILKIYDKAKQYRWHGLEVESDTLRIEVKVNRMNYLKIKKLKVDTLEDLLSLEFDTFADQLIKEWNKVLFYDFTCTKNAQSYLQYRDKVFWKEKLSRQSKSAFEKHRSKLRNISELYSDNVQSLISEEIRSKVKNLQKGCGK